MSEPFNSKSIQIGEYLWKKYRPLICVDFRSREPCLIRALRILSDVEARGLFNYGGITLLIFPRPFIPQQLN